MALSEPPSACAWHYCTAALRVTLMAREETSSFAALFPRQLPAAPTLLGGRVESRSCLPAFLAVAALGAALGSLGTTLADRGCVWQAAEGESTPCPAT